MSTHCRVGLVNSLQERPTASVGVPIVTAGTRGFAPRCRPVLALTDTTGISTIRSGFAPFCNASDQRCANLYRASQGAHCSALKLGVLQRYPPEPMPAITAVRSAQSTKINPKTLSGGSQIISIIPIVLPEIDRLLSD